jgi:predicted transcriptional regulator
VGSLTKYKLTAFQLVVIDSAILKILSDGKPQTATEICQKIDRDCPDHRATSSQIIDRLFDVERVSRRKDLDCIRFWVKL